MRLASLAGVIALLLPASALAQSVSAEPPRPETRLFVEANAGVGYSFPNGFGFPAFDESSANSSFTLGVERSLGKSKWTLALSYLEASNDREGHRASLSYSDECAPFSISSLSCSVGVQWTELENISTVKYNAGLRGSLGEFGQLRPVWTLKGSVLTGDRTETALAAGVEAPFNFGYRGTDDPRWTITGSAALVHGFEAETTLPTWGVSVAYNFSRSASLSVGYESRAVLDQVEDDLDVDRSATAKLKVKF